MIPVCNVVRESSLSIDNATEEHIIRPPNESDSNSPGCSQDVSVAASIAQADICM